VPKEQFEATLAGPERPTTIGIIAASKEPGHQPMDPKALWLWEQLRDFERRRIFAEDVNELLSKMTGAMLADTLRLVPIVRNWLGHLQGIATDRDIGTEPHDTPQQGATLPLRGVVAPTVSVTSRARPEHEDNAVPLSDSMNAGTNRFARTKTLEMQIPEFLDRRAKAS
jgi:hypothetical protein